MGQLRQNFVLQSEAENEIYAGFLVSFSNQKPGMNLRRLFLGFRFRSWRDFECGAGAVELDLTSGHHRELTSAICG